MFIKKELREIECLTSAPSEFEAGHLEKVVQESKTLSCIFLLYFQKTPIAASENYRGLGTLTWTGKKDKREFELTIPACVLYKFHLFYGQAGLKGITGSKL